MTFSSSALAWSYCLMLRWIEATWRSASRSLGFFGSTSLKPSSAFCAIFRLSGVSRFGNDLVAVGRGEVRGGPRRSSGPARSDFWKWSTASSYWPALNACTPLTSWSRALSLAQPTVLARVSSSAAPAEMRALSFIREPFPSTISPSAQIQGSASKILLRNMSLPLIVKADDARFTSGLQLVSRATM